MHRIFFPGFLGLYPGVGIIGYIVILAAIFGIARVLFLRAKPKDLPHDLPKDKPSALDVLTDRFAHGEITIEEFESRVQALEKHNPESLR